MDCESAIQVLVNLAAHRPGLLHVMQSTARREIMMLLAVAATEACIIVLLCEAGENDASRTIIARCTSRRGTQAAVSLLPRRWTLTAGDRANQTLANNAADDVIATATL